MGFRESKKLEPQIEFFPRKRFRFPTRKRSPAMTSLTSIGAAESAGSGGGSGTLPTIDGDSPRTLPSLDVAPLRIDTHTHILPRDWPSFKEQFGYGGFINLEHHTPGWARMMKDDGTFFREVSIFRFVLCADSMPQQPDDSDKFLYSPGPFFFFQLHHCTFSLTCLCNFRRQTTRNVPTHLLNSRLRRTCGLLKPGWNTCIKMELTSRSHARYPSCFHIGRAPRTQLLLPGF